MSWINKIMDIFFYTHVALGAFSLGIWWISGPIFIYVSVKHGSVPVFFTGIFLTYLTFRVIREK